jgi:hypothetical protein
MKKKGKAKKNKVLWKLTTKDILKSVALAKKAFAEGKTITL